MGDGTEQSPYTREDLLRLIRENGGKAEGLNLSGKTFESGIDLHKLNLEGIILKNATLMNAHLEGARLVVAHLEGADLRNDHLEGAVLGGAYLEGTDLGGANLQGSYLAGAHLEGASLMVANLEGADLTGANLEGAYLWRTEHSHDTQLDGTHWGNYILGTEREGGFGEAEDTYRGLKVWYTEHGIYNVAGEFFFREMTVRRKVMAWWPNPLNRASSKLISMLCGYGERPSNVVISALVVIFGLATVYVYGGLDLPYSMYFSAVSFTALGYGSWAHTPPSNWVQGLGAFESFLGVFMMALFLITFIRKMTR